MLVYTPNDSAALQNRAQITLSRLGEAWMRAEGGPAFIRSLRTFLSGLKPDTYRSYQFALLEFYDWLGDKTGTVPLPKDVLRDVAGQYVAWLQSRGSGVLELRLHKDPARMLERAIYDIVKQRPGAHIGEIAQTLSAYDVLKTDAETKAPDGSTRTERVLAVELQPGGLDRYLACLVERKILSRKPTVEELRRLDEQEERKRGRRSGKWTRSLGQRTDDPNVFAYYLPAMTAPGVQRAGTVQTRIAALSSFWQFLIKQSGENTGQPSLLQHNIWAPYLKDISPKARNNAAARKHERTPTEDMWQRLLATTLNDDGTPKQDLEDVRDRAVLLALYHLGLRAVEIGRLTRDDLSQGVPQLLTIVGKGDKTRTLPVPPQLATALEELRGKIQELSLAAERANPTRVPRMSRLLDGDAPLLPAVSRWGCAAASERAEREAGLSRPAVAMMMRRRAVAAGIDPRSADFKRIHPHGFRHMAATLAMLRGTPANVVQAILGHTSLATTGRYTDAINISNLVLHQGAPGVAATPTAPVYAPPQTAVPRAAPALQPPLPEEPYVVPYRPPPAAKKPSMKVIETTGTVEVVDEPSPAALVRPTALAQASRTIPPQVLTVDLDDYDDDEPLPPMVEEGDFIIAVGELAPLGRPLPSAVELARAGSYGEDDDDEGGGAAPEAKVGRPSMTVDQQKQLDAVYRNDRWGERPSKGGPSPVVFMHASKTGNEEFGIDPAADVLTQVSVSSRTNLPWFWGDGGRLEPAMPVMYGPDSLGDAGQLFTAAESYETTPGDDGAVVAGLDRLWHKWMENDDGKRGATATTSLMMWLRHALAITEQVGLGMRERNTTWVRHYDVVPEGSSHLREHRNDMIVRWFEARAWTYAPTRGRIAQDGDEDKKRLAKVRDSQEYEPWYSAADPVRELPDGEREELFDLLDAIMSQRPRGTTPRYHTRGASEPDLTRADLSRVISALCGYDSAREEVGNARAGTSAMTVGDAIHAAAAAEVATQSLVADVYLGKDAALAATRTGTAPATWRQLSRWRMYAGLRLDELAARMSSKATERAALQAAIDEAGGSPEAALPPLLASSVRKLDDTLKVKWVDVDVPSVRDLAESRSAVIRAQEHTPESTKKASPLVKQRRGASYLAFLSQMFGPDVAQDRVLGIAAYCGKYPPSQSSIAGAKYADFFHIDDAAQTITHSDAFKASFAQAVGAHSECVARRVARHIWELKKSGAKRLLFERHSELVEQLDTWAYIRAACAPELESDLRSHLGQRATFDEALAAITGAKLGTELEQAVERLTPQERAMLEEGMGDSPFAQREVFVMAAPSGEYERNPSRFYLANAAQRVPSPVLIMAWSYLAISVVGSATT